MPETTNLTPASQRIASTAAVGLLALEGLGLLVISPLLFFLGGWGGADSGGMTHGIVNVLGVPWLLFGVCAMLSIYCLRHNRVILALIAALVPVLATGALIWHW